MTTVPQLVTAVAKVSPDAADELCRLALYETLADLVDADRPYYEGVLKREIAQTNDVVRRELVRKFVDARLRKVDVTPLLQAAGHLTLLDYEIAKADDNEAYLKEHNVDNGPRGRFIRRGQKITRTVDGKKKTTTVTGPQAMRHNVDVIHELTKPNTSNYAGMGEKIQSTTRGQAVSMLGRALQATGHPGASAAGVALDLAGQLDPEVTQVLGNNLKRAAYRYRGTERRPDTTMLNEMASADRLAVDLTSPDPERRTKAKDKVERETGTGKPGGPRGRGQDATQIADYNVSRRGLSRDQMVMSTQADVATKYLMGKVPHPEDVNLSQKADKMPPSQGVLISRDGKVVSEAVGYNGDHYLPFDLRNLSAMHGGQYVRTRAYGGLTSEDIYAALLSGARKVTVVSNSGVFTMELDPDLRGGRRYNDKARQMVGRYDAMLKTINEGKVTTGQLPEEELTRIRREALKEAQDAGDVNLARDIYDKKRQELEASELFMSEDESYTERAHQIALGEAKQAKESGAKQGQYSNQAIARRTRELEGELKAEALTNQYRQVKLNAQGYHRALRALKGEFPYYVRDVDYTPLEQWQADRGLTDERTGNVRHLTTRGVDPGFVNTSTHLAYGTKRRTAGQSRTAEVEEPTDKPSGGLGVRAPAAAPAQRSAPERKYGDYYNLPNERQDKVDAGTKAARSIFDATDVAENVPDNLAAVRTPAALSAWVEEPANKLTDAFVKMSPTEQDSFLERMTSRQAAENSTRNPNDTHQADQIHDAMNEMAKGLVQLAPHGEAPTLTQDDQGHVQGTLLRPHTEHSRPLAFAEITQHGLDEQKLKAWQAVQAQPHVKAAITELNGKTNAEAREHINDLIEAYRKEAAKPTKNVGAQNELLKKIAGAQEAFAYHKAVEMTHAPGKARAPQAGAVSQRLGDPREVYQLALADLLRAKQ